MGEVDMALLAVHSRRRLTAYEGERIEFGFRQGMRSQCWIRVSFNFAVVTPAGVEALTVKLGIGNEQINPVITCSDDDGQLVPGFLRTRLRYLGTPLRKWPVITVSTWHAVGRSHPEALFSG